MNSKKQKIAIYIDGSNFYFSVKKTFNCKIDIEKFCKKLVGNDDLISINYYISPIGETNPKVYVEQQRFLEKLKKINKLKIIFGRLEKRKRDGEGYYVEKATDINLAQDMIFDAIDNNYDLAYLISNDGDFSGVISSIIKRFDKEVIYISIGNRKSISYHLKKVVSRTIKITKDFINNITIN
jgi:uncharacterized LabA/DUF88 family protein